MSIFYPQQRTGTTRRGVLRGMAGLGLLALTGCSTSAQTGADVLLSDPEIKKIVDGIIGVDMHSHAAGVVGRPKPTFNLAERMRTGGMTAACLCSTGDGPVIRMDADNRVHPVRDPAPGELYRWNQRRLQFIDTMVSDQGLRRMLKPGDLERAHQEHAPSIVQTIEGCQFLDGKLERVGEVYKRGVRHLQLVHYYRSDLGDNQTETPTQAGLTPLGREVIAECNRLGIVVDVAHGTMEFVEAAAKVCRTPLILSHTAMARYNHLNPFTRLISREHAKLVADTGGVVGIWGSPGTFPSLQAYIDGIAVAVDAAGVDHVGFGTDLEGVGPRDVWATYADFPVVVSLLRRKGFNAAEIGKLVGGNYVRVFDLSTRAV